MGVSREEGPLTRYVLVCPALSEASESPGLGRACPKHWPGSRSRRVRIIRVTRSGSGLPLGSPGRADTVHGPAHPGRRTRWGERRRGAPPAGVPAASTGTGVTRRLSDPGRSGWPAGASPKAGGWAQDWSNNDDARRAKHPLVCADQSSPD